jgi:hypothetical protein
MKLAVSPQEDWIMDDDDDYIDGHHLLCSYKGLAHYVDCPSHYCRIKRADRGQTMSKSGEEVTYRMWLCVYNQKTPALSVTCCHSRAQCRQVLVTIREIEDGYE